MIWSLHLLLDHLGRDTVKRNEQEGHEFYHYFYRISSSWFKISLLFQNKPHTSAMLKHKSNYKDHFFRLTSLKKSQNLENLPWYHKKNLFVSTKGFLPHRTIRPQANSQQPQGWDLFFVRPCFPHSLYELHDRPRNTSKTLHCNGKIHLGNAVNIH